MGGIISREPSWNLDQARSDYISRFIKPTQTLSRAKKEQIIAAASSEGLREQIAFLHANAPASLAPYIERVLVATPSHTTTIQAEAIAYGATSRVVILSQPARVMLGFLGTAIASFLDDFRKFMGIELKRSPKKILPTADAIAHMEDTGKQFAHRHHDFLLGEAKRLVSDLVRSPKDLPRLAGRWVKLPHPNTMHLYFADRAAEFVLAHELSHHLLNHPAKAASNSSAPARRYLTQRFAEIDHEFPTDISKSHLHEFEADALALFLLLGDGADATASYGRAIDAVAAAFSALLAFDLMEELTAAQPSSNPLGLEPRNTHPMMRDRAIALLDLTGLAAPDHPDGTEFNWHLGRTVSRRVEGHALQLWACRAFMSEVLTSRLWLPRETVRGELSPMLAGAPDTLPRISMQLDGPRDQANWSLR